jgi:hypothetical protein
MRLFTPPYPKKSNEEDGVHAYFGAELVMLTVKGMHDDSKNPTHRYLC